MRSEDWRSAVGWEGLYEVSDCGRVRNVSTGRMKLPTIHKPSGYPMVTFKSKGRKATYQVHRLVLHAFVGPRPAGLVSCHTNGDPQDNRLENLRYDTPRANNLDKVRHGRDHNASKTHCKRGHEFTPENTITDHHHPHHRKCRICAQKLSRDYMRRKRAENRQTIQTSKEIAA